MMKELPINAAARNVVWVYDHVVAPRFPKAPAIIETTRSHRMPDFEVVPEGSDISAELYGRALTLSLRGDNHRVYIARFTFASYASDAEARAAFMSLWRRVERLESVAEIEEAAQVWLEEQSVHRSPQAGFINT